MDHHFYFSISNTTASLRTIINNKQPLLFLFFVFYTYDSIHWVIVTSH